MITQANHIYGVLTGDLINSSKLTLEQSQETIHRLKSAAADFAKLHPAAVRGELDTFRGDGWQWLLTSPGIAVRAAVFIRAALIMRPADSVITDTRISIGAGTVESIGRDRISNSRGKAFTLSGRGLDFMDKQRLCMLIMDGLPPAWEAVTHGTIPLLDALIAEWTPKEARSIHSELRGLTQEETAREWPLNPQTGATVTRQTIAKAQARAHREAIIQVLDWLEQLPAQST